MKKQFISLIALVAVLGAATAAFVLLQGGGEEPLPDPAPAADILYVLGGNPQPFVTEVKIQNELDTFVIKNHHENAIAMQNASAPDFGIDGIAAEYLNAALMKSVVTACAALDATQLVAEGGDLAVYGLASPRATVEAVYDSGSAVIKIGDDAPGGGSAYVEKDGSVYLVSASKLGNMLLSRFGFADKSIIGGTAETALTHAVIGGSKFPEPIVIDRPDEQNEQLVSMGLTSYLITSPVETGADVSKAIPALTAAFGLTATEVVALADENDALAAHGLGAPYLTTEIETGDPGAGSFTLQFSEPDAEGNVFVRRLERPFLYKLPAASVPWYSLELFDYMQKTLILPFIDTLSEVEVIEGDAIYSFTLAGEGDDLTVTLGDAIAVDADAFRTYYQTLISASLDSEVPEGEEAPADAPVPLQFVYRYRSGAEADVVSFSPGPARRYYIRLNDGPWYYTKSTYVDRVIADLYKVSTGEEVDSYL